MPQNDENSSSSKVLVAEVALMEIWLRFQLFQLCVIHFHVDDVVLVSSVSGAVYLEGGLEEARQLFGRLLFNSEVPD